MPILDTLQKKTYLGYVDIPTEVAIQIIQDETSHPVNVEPSSNYYKPLSLSSTIKNIVNHH